jgi:hypothetical protein
VESRGGRFSYHDGGLEDGVRRLKQQLAAADLVVCHSACLNHEAYRRVKTFCRGRRKACIFLERPSVAHFERCLGSAEAAPRAAGPAALAG